MKRKPLSYNKPQVGDFHATCRRGAWVLEQDVPPGTDLDTLSSRWDKKRNAGTFLVQCALDTHDRAEFEAHIAEVHGGGSFVFDGAGLKPYPADRRTYAPRFPIKLRTGPVKGAAEGRPFKPSTKDLARSVETCSCGLVAEVDGSQATELWWTEHLRGCAIVQAAS